MDDAKAVKIKIAQEYDINNALKGQMPPLSFDIGKFSLFGC